jgi:hypothetical protein
MYRPNLTKSKSIFFIVAVLATAVYFSSCKKDSASVAVTEEEATEVITQAVSAESGGLTTQTEIAARTASESTLSCDQAQDTLFSGSNEPGTAITYSYSQQASTKMICENQIPSQFQFNFSGQNSYSAPRMSSSDNNTASFVVSGLKPMLDHFTINQTYTRNGTQQSKVRLQRSFSSVLTITSTDVTVNKETSKITGGTAAISFQGTGSDGGKVSYGATLVFLGNNQATLTFNNGQSYSLQW